MFVDYINAGFPAIMLITHEYDRAEEVIRSAGSWETLAWDCVRGVRAAGRPKVLAGLLNPVEAKRERLIDFCASRAACFRREQGI